MSKKFMGGIPKRKVDGEEIPMYFCPYFVGDILQTVSEVSPNVRYPGTTWQKIEEETYLVSASSNHPVKSTFGENEHTLTVDEMPKLTFQSDQSVYNDGFMLHATGGSNYTTLALASQGYGVYNKPTTHFNGGGQAHNNMPKSYAVYIWLRVA